MDAQVSIPGQEAHPPLGHLGDAALLAAQNMQQNVQNMQRLLYTYRTIAAHTIGGPSSTSLEAKPGQLPPPTGGGVNGMYRQNSDNNNLVGPPNRKLTPLMYNSPWSLNAAAAGISERRRNSSSSSSGGVSLASSTPRGASRGDREASSSVLETELENQAIACFNIGGELRLCLTQIIHLVLNSFPFSRINQACEELQIFCSTADSSQLNQLKRSKVLPATTPQCGLITKSDAERLCSYLLIKQTPAKPSSSPPAAVSEDAAAMSSTAESGSSPPRIRVGSPGRVGVGSPGRVGVVSPDSGSTTCVRVQHNCFGKCVGSLDVSKAGEEVQGSTQPEACIECEECSEMFTPAKFVCHTHQRPEKGIVHWGFSRDNWSAYIQIYEEYSSEEKEKKDKILNEFKTKFSQSLNAKRKSDENDEELRKRMRETKDLKDSNIPEKPNHVPLTIPNIHPFEKAMHPAAALGAGLVDPRQIFPWALVAPHHNYMQSLAHIQLRIMLDQQQLQQQQQLQAQQQQLHHLQQLPPQLHHPALQGLHQQLAVNPRWPPLLAGNVERGRLPENVSPPVSQVKETSSGSEHHGFSPLGNHSRSHMFASRLRDQSPILGRPRGDQSPALAISRDQSPAPALRQLNQSPVPLRSRDHGSPVLTLSSGRPRSRDFMVTPSNNDIAAAHQEKPPVFDEAMVGVAAVLAASGLGEKSKLEVLGVVERLVERLKRAEMEKISAALHQKGMEERISSLEAELQRSKSCGLPTTTTNNTTNNNNNSSSKQEDETSSDGGIESGTEVDGDLV